jgi:catechol 2,3-dioxygenase-like lactoylglutathione lyase family enzyme
MHAPRFGLDHVVILCRDLDATARTYARLGFTLAPLMYHPFGTANRMLMFRQNFVELVGIARPEALSGPGALIAERLSTHGPGAYGLALVAQDIELDVTELRARRLEVGPIGRGGRTVPLPDGTNGEARFSTATIGIPTGLDWLLLFLAQQHVPEVVWVPAWQRHDNGALAIRGLTMCVPEPARVAPFLSALFGEAAVRRDGAKLIVRMPLGVLDVIAPVERASGDGALTAVSIEVADLDEARRCVAGAGVAVVDERHGFRVCADDAGGVALDFQAFNL